MKSIRADQRATQLVGPDSKIVYDMKQIISTLVRPDEKERVLIVRRSDGLITYQRQWQDAGHWTEPGPDCGIYDSQAAAESEAGARIWWVREMLRSRRAR